MPYRIGHDRDEKKGFIVPGTPPETVDTQCYEGLLLPERGLLTPQDPSYATRIPIAVR